MLNPRNTVFEERNAFQAASEAPLVRMSLTLSLGIWAGDAIPSSPPTLLYFLALSSLSGLITLFWNRITSKRSLSNWPMPAALSIIAVLSLGISLGQTSKLTTERKAIDIERLATETDQTELQLRLPQGRRIGQSRVTASVGEGTVYAYFPSSDLTTFPPSAIIQVEGKLQRIPAPKNPYQFDNQTYARHRGISFRIQVLNYKAVGRSSDLRSVLSEWQQKAVVNLSSTLTDPRARQVLPALTLGLQGEIDEETYGWYTKTGAVHVLSVSGFHVALLAGIVGWMLGLLRDKRPAARWLSLAVALCLIWLYTGITGLAPATVRSAWMLSLVAFSQTMRRGSNGFNALAGAVVLQLILSPGILWDIGFQLSVSAVAGMLALSAPLSKLIAVPKILEGTKEATLAGVAAQIGALLPALVHFGRLPVWFLPASLPVGVLGNLALVLGLIASIGPVGPLGFVGKATGFLAEFFLKALHRWLEAWADLPGAVLDFGPVTPLEATLWLLAVVFMKQGLFHRKWLALIGVGALMLSGLALWQWEIRPNSERKEWTVYAAGRQALALNWREDGAILYADERMDSKRIAMLAGNHLRLVPFSPEAIDTVWLERGQYPVSLPQEAPWPNDGEKAWQSAE